METRRQTLSDCDSCSRTTAATYFPQCNTTASLPPGATTSCFIATETAYSKGTQNDYRFGFCSCGFSASPVETITQPFLPNYRAPHNYLTMLSHTSTFDYRSKAVDWQFSLRFFTTIEHLDSTAIVHLSCTRHSQYSSKPAFCGYRRPVIVRYTIRQANAAFARPSPGLSTS
jgi:hypothetical protein